MLAFRQNSMCICFFQFIYFLLKSYCLINNKTSVCEFESLPFTLYCLPFVLLLLLLFKFSYVASSEPHTKTCASSKILDAKVFNIMLLFFSFFLSFVSCLTRKLQVFHINWNKGLFTIIEKMRKKHLHTHTHITTLIIGIFMFKYFPNIVLNCRHRNLAKKKRNSFWRKLMRKLIPICRMSVCVCSSIIRLIESNSSQYNKYT